MKKIKMIILIVFVLLNLTACSKEKTSIVINYGEVEQTIESEIIYNNADAIIFPAVVRSSGEKPVETEYKGIELTKLLSSLNIDISKSDKITISASDGYRIILDIEEIEEPSNVYLTFDMDGELLKSKKQGGNGPFQLVIRRDPFSQRWVKHVNKISIE
ncbi:MAG: molybdopterin-dependent oxidoreductase [Sedimentibacter sp.]